MLQYATTYMHDLNPREQPAHFVLRFGVALFGRLPELLEIYFFVLTGTTFISLECIFDGSLTLIKI